VADGLFGTIPSIAECIRNMGFTLWTAPPGTHYLTSDRPLDLWNLRRNSPFGIGWENRDACGLLALSPQKYLHVTHFFPGEVRGLDDTPEGVAVENARTLARAGQEVYCCRESSEADKWMKS
jgi:hypothetical protein